MTAAIQLGGSMRCLWVGRVDVVVELGGDRRGDVPVELTSTSWTEPRRGGFVERVEWHGGHWPVVAQSVDELAKGMMTGSFADAGTPRHRIRSSRAKFMTTRRNS
jgi:hypothetical protein